MTKLKLNVGRKPEPPRIILFGPNAIGKSTYLSKAKNHVILDFENGLSQIDCTRTDVIKDWMTLITTLGLLASEPKDMDWLGIDSLEWLEHLIHQQVVDEEDSNKVKSIADIGYGKGYAAAAVKWQYILQALEYIRRTRNCGIVCVAHAEPYRIEPPDMDSYDQYQPALHKSARALLTEWCDELFYVGYKVHLRKEDMGYNKERALAIGSGERYIRTQETPAIMAKSRLTLPAEIPFEWEYFVEQLTETNKKGTK